MAGLDLGHLWHARRSRVMPSDDEKQCSGILVRQQHDSHRKRRALWLGTIIVS